MLPPVLQCCNVTLFHVTKKNIKKFQKNTCHNPVTTLLQHCYKMLQCYTVTCYKKKYLKKQKN